mmetsp:Transcript_51218/g.136731  ORF Transcript_51218/g.136731 Transcript_51218/m.136731 type:complete len:97 (-) Transcript_51218:138-428(-)|eukprot:CAMPEP_0194493464 /NCGR_PEP_ID=MMETSP0253-20130528/11668_1 /TAXON_ID=2966 /ORGANISM="Noctiluca scintillans" /LENGTH=96 /DNA_ID=CAMNT_0039334453 /DNA_START=55 /DNA_END=345 /DNA_ORIENTATION=-
MSDGDRQLRQRRPAAKAGTLAKPAPQPQDDIMMDPVTREYVEYFKEKYGDHPRSDILGIDGCGLFCLMYIVIAGVVLSLLYFSVYARDRRIFGLHK